MTSAAVINNSIANIISVLFCVEAGNVTQICDRTVSFKYLADIVDIKYIFFVGILVFGFSQKCREKVQTAYIACEFILGVNTDCRRIL